MSYPISQNPAFASPETDRSGSMQSAEVRKFTSPLAFAVAMATAFAALGFSDVFKYGIVALAFFIAVWALFSSRPLTLIPHVVLLSQFDTPYMYLHSGLGLRIWYVPFIAVGLRFAFRYPFKMRFLILLPIIFTPALIASNGSGLLFFAKWCIFYVCPVLLIVVGAGISLRTRPGAFFTEYVLPLVVLIGVMGIAQLVGNLLGGAGNNYYPQGDGWDIRPWGPYSETTWFGEFFVLAFAITSTALHSRGRNAKRSRLIGGFLLAGEFLLAAASVSRNIVVGFGVLGMMRPRFGLLLAALATVALVLLGAAGTLEGRLNFSGSSAQEGMGRMQAFKMEVHNLSLEPKGFDWDDSESTNEGNAIGSRSFNSVLFLMNSCGAAYGLLVVVVVFLVVMHFLSTPTAGSVVPLTVFCAMSMFAPLHFYPAFGVLLGVVLCQFIQPWRAREVSPKLQNLSRSS